MTQIKEKKHRLPGELYIGFVTVAFTACIMDRVSVFTNPLIVTQFTETLITEAAKSNCEITLFLFMPDHLHAILKGKSITSEPLKTMNQFKQKTGYWFSKNNVQARWQKSFFDHLIRDEKDILKHVRYVLNNPVRKGIVTDWLDYPFKGSMIYNLNNETF